LLWQIDLRVRRLTTVPVEDSATDILNASEKAMTATGTWQV
jgi:hypothetical protein